MLIKKLEGKDIRIREKDRFVCLTDIAEIGKSCLGNWYRTNKAKDLIAKVARKLVTTSDQILEIRAGRLTYAHPELARAFTRWMVVSSEILNVDVDAWFNGLFFDVDVEQVEDESNQDVNAILDEFFANSADDREEEHHLWSFGGIARTLEVDCGNSKLIDYLELAERIDKLQDSKVKDILNAKFAFLLEPE